MAFCWRGEKRRYPHQMTRDRNADCDGTDKLFVYNPSWRVSLIGRERVHNRLHQ